MTLAEPRHELLRYALDDEWRTPSELGQELGLDRGVGWFKTALVLERLAHEGVAELRNPASRDKQWFRRAP